MHYANMKRFVDSELILKDGETLVKPPPSPDDDDDNEDDVIVEAIDASAAERPAAPQRESFITDLPETSRK